ncbi:MAG: transcriptional regulator [Methylocystis sp.]|nr:MAG: transcriptional regulator [Methylocystis sp.]
MEIEIAIGCLAALSQQTRLDAFRQLVRAEPRGLPAGDLARSLSVPQNTLSAHLNVLSHAKLVTSARSGRSVVYRADLTRLNALVRFLVEDCCGGVGCAPLVADLASCCPPLETTSPKETP